MLHLCTSSLASAMGAEAPSKDKDYATWIARARARARENCQHKQRTANRTIPTGKLQNRQLPYKESKGKNFAGPPLATKQDGKEYVSATPQAGVLRRIITA